MLDLALSSSCKSARRSGAPMKCPLFRRLKQEDQKFKARIGNLGRPCVKTKGVMAQVQNTMDLISSIKEKARAGVCDTLACLC